jgi:hypothetical protein
MSQVNGLPAVGSLLVAIARLAALAHLRLERRFLLIFPGLLLAGVPLCAQTGKAIETPACIHPASGRTGEAFLAGPAEGALDDCVARDVAARADATSAPTPVIAATSAAPLIPVTPAGPASPEIAPVNHRLFGMMANYTTVEKHEQFSKLSPATKFKLTLKTMTDPVTVSFLAGIALLGQARNSDPSYGQGLMGYGKRFGTFYADTGIGTLMTTSVFPTVLHQDPRYFQLGQGSVRQRFVHAVSSIFLTHSDEGARQFNYSQVMGNAVAASISNAYRPESQRTVGSTMTVWGTDTLLNVFCNVAKEFWPSIRGRLHQQFQGN